MSPCPSFRSRSLGGGETHYLDWSAMKTTKLLSLAISILMMFGATTANAVQRPIQRCAEWWALAKQAGWQDRHLPTLDYILWRESRCNPKSINKVLNQDGSWDYGLTQINDRSWCKTTRWYPDGYLQSLEVLDYCKDLLNPYVNLKAAKSLYDYSQKINNNGFQPWGL